MIFLILALVILIGIMIYSSIRFYKWHNKWYKEYHQWWKERFQFQQEINKINSQHIKELLKIKGE